MKSNTVILIGCWILMILHWTTDMFPGGIIPAAFCGSYMIMWLFGAFKNENQFHRAGINDDGEIEDGLSDRQKDFIEKMRQGKEEFITEPDSVATIKLIDEDGNHSSVIIMEDGEIKTEGNPNPDIVAAAKLLNVAILQSGPDAIAQELGKAIAKIEEDQNNGNN